ncbi:MAG TPA: hypothetical protein VGF98_10885 [Candidatus Tumulicola sp.]|jgi:hypothetical protein
MNVNTSQYSGLPGINGPHHYVVTYDGTSVKLYVALVNVVSATATVPTLSETGSLLRWANGANLQTNTHRFAKLTSYSAVLTSSQMAANYGAGNGV